MRSLTIEDLLEFLMEVNEVLHDSAEWLELLHTVKLTVYLSPFDVIKPISWVGDDIKGSTGTSEEESPLLEINLVCTEENLGTEQE